MVSSGQIDIQEPFPPSFSVAERRVVITGAAGGLGAVLAAAFARGGARLSLVSRDKERLTRLAESLPGRHCVFAGDVRDEEFNDAVVRAVVEEQGGLDTWIGNAGVSPVVQPAEFMDAEVWRTIIDTNLSGTFLGARAAARSMNAGSSIILTSSVIADRSRSGLIAYAASKAALNSVVRSLAIDLADRDITVNAIAPGWFDSPLAGGFRARADLEREILDHTTLGRWGQASDLPGLFLFLSSQAARFITGAVIPLDGGYLLR